MKPDLNPFENFKLQTPWKTLIAIIATVCLNATCNAEDLVGYDQVKEILRKRCVTCHNPDELRGDLDLKDLAGIKAGASSGPVVVAKDPNSSLLYTTVAHLEDPKMPPNSPRLPAREQDLIRRWIEGGLQEKSNSGSADTSPKVASEETGKSKMDLAPTEASKPHEGLAQVKSLPQATAIRAMDAHPSRDLVAVSGLRQAVFIQPSSGEILGAVDTPLGNVTAIRFSRDGKLLMVGVSQPAVQGTVSAFDVESGKLQWQVGDETDSILAMDLSTDGKTLAVGGPSRTVRLYNVSTGEVVHSLKKHTDWILTLQFSPDGLLLASGDRFGAIFVWDPKQGSVFQDLKDHTGAVQSIAWDQDGETLVSGGKDGFLRTWNLHHGQRTSRWDAEVGEILSVSMGPNAIVATGRRNRISAWNSPESSLATIELSDQGEAVAFCNDNRRLIATDASGKISTVDLSESRVIQCIALPVDTGSTTKLVQRIESENVAYRLELERSKMMERSLATESSAAASNKSATLPVPSVSAMPVAKLQEQIRFQIESGKQQLETVTAALKTSNESLANLARLNQDLVSLVGQSSQIQAQLAGQIAEQSKLLQAMQERLSQLEATLNTPQ